MEINNENFIEMAVLDVFSQYCLQKEALESLQKGRLERSSAVVPGREIVLIEKFYERIKSATAGEWNEIGVVIPFS